MRNADDIRTERDKKLKEFEEEQNKISGQWKLIESIIDNYEVTKDTKYIDLSNVGKIYRENEMKLIFSKFFIAKDKNNKIKLFLSDEEYSEYLKNIDKVKFIDDKKDLHDCAYTNKTIKEKNNSFGGRFKDFESDQVKTFNNITKTSAKSPNEIAIALNELIDKGLLTSYRYR